MRGARAKRSRLLRRAGLVGLPVAAALLLSGCHWGTYSDGGITQFGHAYFVVIHQQDTDNSIHACDDDRGSVTEAKCVLDVIRLACHQDSLKGWAVAECDQATDYRGTTCRRDERDQSCAVSMQRTIAQIRSEQGQCLTYEQNYVGTSRVWDALYTRPGC